ncbi:dihydroneopterin aldolase [Acutalibacter sp. 1XD8-36]|uniref:dihydroneopterin aldolase n=1 Tax=Acutalibacter sp. 1XD8-36 TaxID=2320852 RepID=UPI0014125331|nr:dihydroneopterin aldolase [Acutalibacter sp. 1XD8-36]NBJ90505.1 dihydroneopterin aldolase [Acutalibacter sp. 1XD8-36]
MDKLYIRGLEIFAYHGVNPEEKQDGQHFFMDVTMWADLSRPRQTDRLEDTVNYAAVRKTIHRAFTAESYDLIERAAQAVCEAVLREHPKVEKIGLVLKKPEAPMNASFDYVAVEVELSRRENGGTGQ